MKYFRNNNFVYDLEKEIKLLKSKAIDKINYECDLLHNDYYNDEGLTSREIEDKRTNNINSLIVEKGTDKNGFYIFVYSEDMEEYGVKENYGKFVKQADTIEELCDEFVYNNQLLNPRYIDPKDNELIAFKYRIEDEFNYKNYKEIYGAIWTNKGLIYVAKVKGVSQNCEIYWELL